MTFSTVTANKSYLSPLGFGLILTRTPNVSYFCNKVSLPSVGVKVIKVPNPFVDLNVGGTSIQYGTLTATFNVDEDMNNYIEIYKWMNDLTVDRVVSQYSGILNQSPTDPNAGPRVDASIEILSSSKTPNILFNFIDVFPTNLAPLPFDATLPDVQYVQATAEFSFREFDISKI